MTSPTQTEAPQCPIMKANGQCWCRVPTGWCPDHGDVTEELAAAKAAAGQPSHLELYSVTAALVDALWAWDGWRLLHLGVDVWESHQRPSGINMPPDVQVAFTNARDVISRDRKARR